MTWDEFKELVDGKIRDMNLDGTIPIWYIDISAFPDKENVAVEDNGPYNKDKSLCIFT